MGWVTDIIRSLLWAVSKLFLFVNDVLFDVIERVITLNIGQYNTMWNWWNSLIAFVSLFIVFRVTKIFFKTLMDEEYRDKISYFVIVFRMVPVVLVMLLSPMVIQNVISMSVHVTENISDIIGAPTKIKPSTILVTAGSENLNEELREGEVAYVTLDDLKDINEKQSGSDNYKFLPNYENIILVGLLAGVCAIAMVLISLQFVARLYGLAMKVLISPIPISGLIDPNDNSFGTWVRLIVSDLVTNVAQYLMLLLVLSFSASTTVSSLGIIATAIVLIGGVFAVMKGLPELAQLIGGDVSSGGALQQLATIRMAGQGFKQGMIMQGLGKAKGALGTAGAGITYGLGRQFGGEGKSVLGQALAQSRGLKNEFSGAGNSTAFQGGGQTSIQRDNLAQTRNSQGLDLNSSAIAGGSKGGLRALAKAGGQHLYNRSADRLTNSPTIQKAARVQDGIRKVSSIYRGSPTPSVQSGIVNPSRPTAASMNTDNPIQPNSPTSTLNKEDWKQRVETVRSHHGINQTRPTPSNRMSQSSSVRQSQNQPQRMRTTNKQKPTTQRAGFTRNNVRPQPSNRRSNRSR